MTGVIPQDFEALLRQLVNRVTKLERRPSPISPRDLLGPGIGKQALLITDWNSLAATRNGSYYCLENCANAPGPLVGWQGTTVARGDGAGHQHVFNDDMTLVIVSYARTWSTDPVNGALIFSVWHSL